MNIIAWYDPFAGIIVCAQCFGTEQPKESGWIEVRAVEASEPSTCHQCSGIIDGYAD